MINIEDKVLDYFRGKRNIDANFIIAFLDYNKRYIESYLKCYLYYNFVSD